MKKFLVGVLFLTLICGGCGSQKSKYQNITKDIEQLIADLESYEKRMDDLLIKGEKTSSSCQDELKIASLKEREQKIRKALDEIMPKDMPFTKITEQESLDPNTGIPAVHSVKVVDIGKITGTEQNLWYVLNSAELSVASAVKMLSVGCQCIDGEDKNSVQCVMASAQMDENGRFSLGLASAKSYIAEAKDFIKKL